MIQTLSDQKPKRKGEQRCCLVSQMPTAMRELTRPFSFLLSPPKKRKKKTTEMEVELTMELYPFAMHTAPEGVFLSTISVLATLFG